MVPESLDYDEVMDVARFQPDWRWIESRKTETTSTDPYVQRYRLFLAEGTRDAEIASAHHVFQMSHKRGKIEGGILAGIPLQELADKLALYPITLRGYEKLFFDLSPIDKFDGTWALSDLTNDPKAGELVQQLRRFGFKYGRVFLEWMIEPRKVLDETEKKALADWLSSVLLMRSAALFTEDVKNIQKYGALLKTAQTFVRIISGEEDVSKNSEVKTVLQKFIDQMEDPGAPRGLPSLEGRIAIPMPSQN